MSLNLLKLCVGCESIEDLETWIDFRLRELKAAGREARQFHTTRMIPKRRDELLDGGSLYWVIKGNVQCRQRLLDIQPFRDGDGIERCNLILEPTVVETAWQPRRAFQGWRYLSTDDAPRDLAPGSDGKAMPSDLKRQLSELGLL